MDILKKLYWFAFFHEWFLNENGFNGRPTHFTHFWVNFLKQLKITIKYKFYDEIKRRKLLISFNFIRFRKINKIKNFFLFVCWFVYNYLVDLAKISNYKKYEKNRISSLRSSKGKIRFIIQLANVCVHIYYKKNEIPKFFFSV